jgi:DinB superfamily
MKNDQALREHLLELLSGGHAHLDFEKATAGMPVKLRGAKPPGLPFTPWRLIEHMRIAQWDILQFAIDPHHVSPDFPDGYWPDGDAPPNPETWDQSIAAFRADLKGMMDLVADPKTDLFTPLAHGQGQTILREALLVADHNAYHLGQLMTVRRLLGACATNRTNGLH